jgi:hypothetical protein
MRYIFCLAIFAAVLVGCASTSGTQSSPRRSTNVIAAEEIAASSAKDAVEAINLLRPQWLTARGVSSTGINLDLAVYLNNGRLNDVEMLRGVPASNIVEIRYLSSSEATTLFGTGNMGGAILVKTK